MAFRLIFFYEKIAQDSFHIPNIDQPENNSAILGQNKETEKKGEEEEGDEGVPRNISKIQKAKNIKQQKKGSE